MERYNQRCADCRRQGASRPAPGPCPSPARFNVCRQGEAFSQENARVGMGYVPWQKWECTYPLDRALFTGSIFPSLDKPFVIGRCAVRL